MLNRITMKISRNSYSWMLAGMLATTSLFSSCSKEEDAPPADTGTTDPRAKFVATWSMAENSHDFGPASYSTAISDSSNTAYIQFGFLYGFNKRAYATVSGNNFTLPVQLIQGNNVSGQGVLSTANQINMTYYVQSTASHTDTVTAVLTK